MSDRIEEIKARCEAAELAEHNGGFNGSEVWLLDIPFLLGEIERLTAKCDAAVMDLYDIKDCETCKKHHGACDFDGDVSCGYEWIGVQK